jgi:hypothetical protein
MDFVMVDLSKQRQQQQQQQQHPTIYLSVQLQLPTATSTCRLTCAQQTGQQQRLSAAKTDGQEQQHVYVHPEGNSGPNLVAHTARQHQRLQPPCQQALSVEWHGGLLAASKAEEVLLLSKSL